MFTVQFICGVPVVSLLWPPAEHEPVCLPLCHRGNLTHEAFLRNARNSEETLRKEAIERTNLGFIKFEPMDVGGGEVYQVPSTGAMVSLNSAVGLIHFYCSQLPSDRYLHLVT